MTVGGESAGAFSVANLLASPLAKGLFHRAIAQSGAAFHIHEPNAGADIACLLYTSDAADDMQCVDLGGRRIIKKKKKKKKKYYFFFFFFPSTPFALFFFFFSSRRRHTRFALVSWARRCV